MNSEKPLSLLRRDGARNTVSIRLVQAVRSLQMSAAECAVLVVFAEHANDDGANSFPSAELVAWETNYCEMQVRRIIARLRAMRLLVPETDTNGGRGRVPIYRVCPENGNKKLPFSGPSKPVKGNFLSRKEAKGSQVVGGLSQEKGNIADPKGSHFVAKKGNNLSDSAVPPPPGPLSPLGGESYDSPPVTVSSEPSEGKGPHVQTSTQAPVVGVTNPPSAEPIPTKKGSGSGFRCIPKDFSMTPAMLAWAQEACPGVDVTTETAAMVDWFTAKAKKYADWEAVWRNWMRRQVKFQSERGQSGNLSTFSGNGRASPSIRPTTPKSRSMDDLYNDNLALVRGMRGTGSKNAEG